MEAQYNSMGGVINLITAGGSDEWHVDASLYVNNDKFSATGQYGSQLYDGQNQTTRIPPAPTQGYQANVNVGGPILKHRGPGASKGHALGPVAQHEPGAEDDADLRVEQAGGLTEEADAQAVRPRRPRAGECQPPFDDDGR